MSGQVKVPVSELNRRTAASLYTVPLGMTMGTLSSSMTVLVTPHRILLWTCLAYGSRSARVRYACMPCTRITHAVTPVLH